MGLFAGVDDDIWWYVKGTSLLTLPPNYDQVHTKCTLPTCDHSTHIRNGQLTPASFKLQITVYSLNLEWQKL